MVNRKLSIAAVAVLTGGVLALALLYATASSSQAPAPGNGAAGPPEVVHYRYRVVRTYPHDRTAFTQGLVYEDGFLYEGTGLYGQSTLSKRDLQTGRALRTIHLSPRHFGEGITIFGDKIIQVTWRNQVGFVYEKDTFALLGQFTYPTEGWGITHDGQQLIYSDGTATLRFLDPNTYTETRRIEVFYRNRPVKGLNELAFIEGLVFANVWPTDRIVAIDPGTGRVRGWLDLSDLYPDRDGSEDVLNGVTYMPETGHLLVTGKLWPKVYEIELTPLPPGHQQ